MNEKCKHETTSILGYHSNVSLEVCDWGCGAVLVSVADDNGISHVFTPDELLALRERLANNHTAMSIYQRDIAALRERVAQLEGHLLDTRCQTHRGSTYPFYCVICGKPLPHVAGDTAPTYRALRERVAALEALTDSVGILCEEMYGAEHLQPFPVDMIPEAAKQKMDAVLDAWGKTNELGALLYEQPRAFYAEAANNLLETKADLWQKMADEGGE